MNPSKYNIAYFSAEIGISASLPTYSGGLGVLAGDHIKAAADIKLPMVAVTLLYREGYFKQRINQDGKQKEIYPRFDPIPFLQKLDQKITLKLRNRDVVIQAYQLEYKGIDGHMIPIYFLDTDITENHEDDRLITLRLYSGDKDHRILQEAILGFGGLRFLESLKCYDIKNYHMNEGHCSFLTLELLRKLKGDRDKVRSLCHFTTHTPVEAGHDHFSIDRCRKILNNLLPDNLVLPSMIKNKRLHMTELGLNFSRSANGVSKLHGEVAQNQFTEFKLDYITNGIYHPYWLGDSFKKLFDLKIPNWRTNVDLLNQLDLISDDDLESAHLLQKDFLLSYSNSQTQKALSKNILTIGFARRAAEYKRARLIFSDLDRLIDIGYDKIQFIFAGKAHPNDAMGKQIINDIVQNANQLAEKIKIVYLENYNMWLGRLISSGVDVWLNTPLRPMEASGTSGMKAALNGIPNLSIYDGWWAEGCVHGVNGWGIGSRQGGNDKEDADSLYKLLENDVIPVFYNDRKRWISLMRASIKTSIEFTAHRMINQYKNKFYHKL